VISFSQLVAGASNVISCVAHARLRRALFLLSRPLSYTQATADHFIPRANGGKNHATNRVLSCRPCNLHKGDLDPRLYGLATPDETTRHLQELMQRFRLTVLWRQLKTIRSRTMVLTQ
jgi:5-methylcytosine-specific restriction endonuclease McrA